MTKNLELDMNHRARAPGLLVLPPPAPSSGVEERNLGACAWAYAVAFTLCALVWSALMRIRLGGWCRADTVSHSSAASYSIDHIYSLIASCTGQDETGRRIAPWAGRSRDTVSGVLRRDGLPTVPAGVAPAGGPTLIRFLSFSLDVAHDAWSCPGDVSWRPAVHRIP